MDDPKCIIDESEITIYEKSTINSNVGNQLRVGSADHLHLRAGRRQWRGLAHYRERTAEINPLSDFPFRTVGFPVDQYPYGF